MEGQIVVRFFWMFEQISCCYSPFVHAAKKFLCSDAVSVGAEQKNFHEFFNSKSAKKVDGPLCGSSCLMNSLKRDVDCFGEILKSSREFKMATREGFPLFWKSIED